MRASHQHHRINQLLHPFWLTCNNKFEVSHRYHPTLQNSLFFKVPKGLQKKKKEAVGNYVRVTRTVMGR